MNAPPGPGYLDELKLALGDSGPAVAEVRDRLGRLELLEPGRHSDLFDDDLATAVRRFQQQRGITIDGVVGPLTFRRLEEARWNLGDRVLSYSPGRVTAGDDVAQLQRGLSRLGFGSGRVDGVFGPETDGALRDFQRNVGLEVDGTCGPAAWRALSRLARSVSGGDPDQLQNVHANAWAPTGVAGKVVLIDPGHGGPDYGHVFHRLAESIVADDLSRRIEGRLAAIGTQVLLSRPFSYDMEAQLSESARAQFANENGVDLVISLHADGESSGRARGVATFYYGHDHGKSVLGERFAQLVQEEITRRTDLPDCRCQPKSWDLLRLTRMPAVRVECGYLSNRLDAGRLAEASFRDAIADGIANAAVRFFAP